MKKWQIYKIYGTDYTEMTKELLKRAKLKKRIPHKNCRIGIKPNLISPTEAVSYTHLDVYKRQLETLYYLHGLRAVPVEGPNVTPVPIEGVRDLEAELKRILTEEKIDAVVHAMAVSDYMVKEVTTLEKIKSGDSSRLEGNKTVSYTHLDVYKRQQLNGLFSFDGHANTVGSGLLFTPARSGAGICLTADAFHTF